MTLTQGLVAYLKQIPEITALCNQQIYGARRPQGLRPLPELLMSRTTTGRFYAFCGQSSLVNCDMQLDVYASGLEQCETLARVVKRTLRGGGMFGDVPVDSVFLTNESEAIDAEPGTVRLIQTYNFWYQED